MENQQPAKEVEIEKERDLNVICVLLTELLFVFLPLVVLIIVFAFATSGFVKVFSKTEWGFVTAILFGQSIVKLVGGFISLHEDIHWARPVLAISVIIVLGLVPSLVVMTMIAVSPEPTLSLIVSQLVLFILSVICFFVIAGTGQSFIMESEEK